MHTLGHRTPYLRHPLVALIAKHVRGDEVQYNRVLVCVMVAQRVLVLLAAAANVPAREAHAQAVRRVAPLAPPPRRHLYATGHAVKGDGSRVRAKLKGGVSGPLNTAVGCHVHTHTHTHTQPHTHTHTHTARSFNAGDDGGG